MTGCNGPRHHAREVGSNPPYPPEHRPFRDANVMWVQTHLTASAVLTLCVIAPFFGFATGIAQPIHRGAQFGLGLDQLIGNLRLALLQISDGLIAGFLGLVQGLRHAVQLADVGLGHAGEPVDQPA